jgi:hypothetical protein
VEPSTAVRVHVTLGAADDVAVAHVGVLGLDVGGAAAAVGGRTDGGVADHGVAVTDGRAVVVARHRAGHVARGDGRVGDVAAGLDRTLAGVDLRVVAGHDGAVTGHRGLVEALVDVAVGLDVLVDRLVDVDGVAGLVHAVADVDDGGVVLHQLGGGGVLGDRGDLAGDAVVQLGGVLGGPDAVGGPEDLGLLGGKRVAHLGHRVEELLGAHAVLFEVARGIILTCVTAEEVEEHIDGTHWSNSWCRGLARSGGFDVRKV